MRVRVSFKRIVTGRLAYIRDLWIGLALNKIRDELRIDPIYRIGGLRKTLTIYKLSEREAKIVFDILHREVDDVIIRDVKLIHSKKETVPAGFVFAEPDFTEDEIEEIEEINKTNLEDNRVYRMVTEVVDITVDVILEYQKE